MRERIKCNHCDGSGLVKDRTAQVAEGVLTFGVLPFIGALMEGDEAYTKPCKVCDGRGYNIRGEA